MCNYINCCFLKVNDTLVIRFLFINLDNKIGFPLVKREGEPNG